MMYLIFFLFPFLLFAQVNLESIEVTESQVSDDLLGLSSVSSPVSVKVQESKILQQQRIKSANDLTIMDAAVTNQYSASGYWDSLKIRGFNVDNRTNYFRDGLRINAQTAIPFENKEAVETVKGLGAFQNAGASPAGSINFRVKRPKDIAQLRLELTQRAGHLAHLDYGRSKNKFKYRFNLLNEEIKSVFSNNDGQRHLLASSFSYELSDKSLLEAEIEWSRRSQTTLGAQSFWAGKLPAPRSTLNLNNQSWAKPVEFDSLFYSVRYSHELSDKWFVALAAGRQYSLSDDRMSYAFGCSVENNWTGFCSDGTFDVYDFRSENERRTTDSTKLSLVGLFEGTVSQELSLNIRYTHQVEKLGLQAYNFVGVGNQRGEDLPANASKLDPSNNMDEESLEFFVVDKFKWRSWQFWAGGNFQYRYAANWKSDGSEQNKSDDFFFTPWLALSRQFHDASLYLSYAQAKESAITPNKPGYLYPSAILPQQTTQQYELGIKGRTFSSAIFYMQRPRLFDNGMDFKMDGHYQQWGWEGNALFNDQHSEHQLSLMYLQVEQFASGVRGKDAPNIPDFTLRYLGLLKFKGFKVGTRVQYESSRYASFDNQLGIPDWINWDFFLEKELKNLSFRAYVDNAFQKSFWKESPIQYGHHYLYQGPGRRAGVIAEYTF